MFGKASKQQEAAATIAGGAGMSPLRADEVTSRNSVYLFSLTMFALSLSVALGVSLAAFGEVSTVALIVSLLAALLVMSCIRIVPQWEHVVILRFGKFSRSAGPGLFLTLPLIEHVAVHIDQRVISTTFNAEEALTADLVPVDVDAALFWVVWSPQKASVEVQDYATAVILSAQTALRDAIGTVNLVEVSRRRKQLDAEIRDLLDEKCSAWGITISSVEIRNISIPQELQNAISREAQADRESNARMLLAETERNISELYVEAAEIYGEPGKALHLRTMNLVYDSVKDGGGMVVVPSAYSEGFAGGDGLPVAMPKKQA